MYTRRDCGALEVEEFAIGIRIAGGRSHPRCASGGCSVYRKKPFTTSIEISSFAAAGSVRRASNRVGRPCASGGV